MTVKSKHDLTDKTILKLAPPATGKGPIDYPDKLAKQLVLTVRPSGGRSWNLRYRFKGKQRRFLIGTWPELSVDDAREKAIAARRMLAKGVDPANHYAEQRRIEALRREHLSERSFPKIAERYVHAQRKRERRSWIATARILGFKVNWIEGEDRPQLTVTESGLASRWADRPLASIERLDVTATIDELTDTDRPEAARTRLNQLKAFFGWATNAGYIERSPVDRYKFDAPKPSRERVLSDDEIRLVWIAAEGAGYPTEQFIRLLLLTGQRRREVAGIAHSEIAGGVWEIPAERSKNKHAHRVPLAPMAAAIIASAPRYMSGAILTTTGRTAISGFSVIKRHLDSRVTKLNGGTPLPEWHLHDIRRSVASGMASIGIAPHVIEQVLNHRTMLRGVAAVYNRHDYLAEKREALERWAEHVAALVSAEPKPVSEPSKIVALRSA